MEELRIKELQKKQKIEERLEKKKNQEELEKKIFLKRAKELEFKMANTEKGEACLALWKGKTVGVFKGALPIEPIIDNFRQERYSWNKINLLVEKAAPLKEFTLYQGLTNRCSCGKNDMYPKEFMEHLKEHHEEMVEERSQINRPPWLDLVEYKDYLIEEKLCYSEEDLDKYLIS